MRFRKIDVPYLFDIAITSMALLLFSPPVIAENAALLKVLLENGAINQQQYDELVKGSKKEPEVTLKNGQLNVNTGDNKFSVRIGGMVHTDAAWYSDSTDGSANDRGQLGDGTEIRRTRIFIQGTVWDDWHFKGEYDFANDNTRVKDAWIMYTGLGKTLSFPLNIQVGNFKEPFSLEQQLSVNNTTFMEPALPYALAPLRNIGITLSSYGDVQGMAWTTTGGWFGSGVSNDNDDGTDETYGYAGRATFAPIAEYGRLLHFGGSFEYRKYKQNNVQVSSRPESNIADQQLVNITLPQVDDLFRYNTETAVVYGPFSAQAEYFHNEYKMENGDSANFEGYYAYTSYILTGESRPYTKQSGIFTGIVPHSALGHGGWGAFEIAARYSYLNLNDGSYTGGQEKNWTLGLNWYPNSSIRFMANYIIVDTDSAASVPIDPQIFEVRAQIAF